MMPTFTLDRWRTLSRYLDHAFALSGVERECWLASLHARNDALAVDVRALLDDHERLERAGFLVEAVPRSLMPVPPLPRSGDALGPYELIRCLGEGGMGSVWLARRRDGRDGADTLVAIKLLNPFLLRRSGDARDARSSSESRILARLSHPSIPRLLDAGFAPAGHSYLVLEYVDGEHIDRYCDGRGLDIASRLRLFLDVLRPVAHAHAKGIVHRDIKPSNVLVGRTAPPRVTLLDFGSAVLLDADTVDDRAALTPAYAAPELLMGHAATIATDIYALGVLLGILLTGQHLADATLDAIIARARHPDPHARYASVTAFADDLINRAGC